MIVITLACALLIFPNVYCKGLKEEFTWTRITYDWPSNYSPSNGNHGPKSSAQGILFPDNQEVMQNENSHNYIVENNIPMGANRWKNKLFVTVPRRRHGVPSSLNFVWINSTERHNVPLIPYPNWELNKLPSGVERGNNIVSVYRVAVDPCDRLWIADSGVIEVPGNREIIQDPSIVIIDLHTDAIIRRYTLKPSVLTAISSVANIAIDVNSNQCNKAFAYIPDLSGYGLIVYSFQENDSWRVNHNYFYLESLAGEFTIGGLNFQWNDGIFSVGLSDIKKDGHRTLYFHSMAGTHLFSVSTRILKDRQLATRSYHENDFQIVLDRNAKSQTSASDLHKSTGILFLGLVNQNALGCWNTRKPAKVQNFDIVQKDDQKMIYPSDVKVYGDEVIVLTNRMPIFLYSQLNYDETNFRVWMANVVEAVAGTACDGSGHKTTSYGYSP